MTVTLVQERDVQASATFTFAAPPTLGNTMILVAASNGTAAVPGYSADWSSAVTAGPNGANDERMACIYKKVTAADVSANSWTFTAFNTGTRGIQGWEVAGLDPIEVNLLALPAVKDENDATGTDLSPMVATGATPTTDWFAISALIMNASMTGEACTGAGGAWTVQSIGNPMAVAHKLANGASVATDIAATWSWTESLRPVGILVVFRGQGAPVEPPGTPAFILKVRQGGAWVDASLGTRSSGAWI